MLNAIPARSHGGELNAGSSGRSIGQRKPDLKTCVAGFRGDLNIASVLPHNSLYSVQAESCSFSNSLGSKERLKDVRKYLRGNAWTIIANLNHHASVVTVGAHAKFTAPAHGINCIVDDVGPDLVELTSKRIHQQRNALIIALHYDSLFQFVIQNRECSFQAFCNVNVLDRRLVHMGVFLDGADQIRNARGTAF